MRSQAVIWLERWEKRSNNCAEMVSTVSIQLNQRSHKWHAFLHVQSPKLAATDDAWLAYVQGT